jgi:hypothetical protein
MGRVSSYVSSLRVGIRFLPLKGVFITSLLFSEGAHEITLGNFPAVEHTLVFLFGAHPEVVIHLPKSKTSTTCVHEEISRTFCMLST